MKTKLIRNIFILSLILFTGFGCSRFEDGPDLSFCSVMNRIYGTYRVEYISKNGVDMTDYWNTYYDLEFKIYRKTDEPKGLSPTVEVYELIDSCGAWKRYGIGYRSFVSIEDHVTIDMYNYMIDTSFYPGRFLYPIFIIADQNNAPVFTITRLTNKEMWLYLEDGNNVFIIKLKE